MFSVTSFLSLTLVLLTYLVVDRLFKFQVLSAHSAIAMADVAVSRESWATSVTIASLDSILSLRQGAGKIFQNQKKGAEAKCS